MKDGFHRVLWKLDSAIFPPGRLSTPVTCVRVARCETYIITLVPRSDVFMCVTRTERVCPQVPCRLGRLFELLFPFLPMTQVTGFETQVGGSYGVAQVEH